MADGNPLKTFDAIATRLVGFVLMGGAGTEVIDPNLLQITMSDAAYLGVCGFFLGTGRASAILAALKRMLNDGDNDG